VRVALMQEHRLTACHGQLQLALEREQPAPRAARSCGDNRVPSPDRDHFRFGVILAQQRFGVGIEIAGMMWVHARGREQYAGMQLRERAASRVPACSRR
jgi:hypothetical protein